MDSSPPAATTQTKELPSWAQPYAQDLLDRSAALSNQQMPVYTGQRSADMNPYQTAGMNMAYQRATNGSPEMQAGSKNLQSTLNGDFLNSNPYLDANVNRASQNLTRNYQAATNNTDAMMARAGAFGGSSWQQAQEGNQRQLSQGLADLNSSMYGQNYANERANQMQALGMAPTYGNQAYTDAQQLAGIGQQQYTYDQQKLSDQRSLWDELAQSPYRQLDVLAGGLSGALGSGGSIGKTTQTGPGANQLAQGVGTAAALYGLLS